MRALKCKKQFYKRKQSCKQKQSFWKLNYAKSLAFYAKEKKSRKAEISAAPTQVHSYAFAAQLLKNFVQVSNIREKEVCWQVWISDL